MDSKMMKVDLHVHSKFSKRPSQWILKRLGCPESFTEPEHIYKVAKKRGMSMVTITDHNSIEGCLEIAHLPDTFISEEVTTYFPEDGCKVHVLVYDITERIHEDIQRLRGSVFDLVGYLNKEEIHHVLAHPLYALNDRLTMEHIEQMMLLFKNIELNGARGSDQNGTVRAIVSSLQPEDIYRLAEKHGMAPVPTEPWEKRLVGGSDDHSSLTIACTYTQVEGARNIQSFLEGISRGEATVVERTSTPLTLAHHIYSIAYQFYRNKLSLDRFKDKDIFIRFLDRIHHAHHEPEGDLLSRLTFFWTSRKRVKSKSRAVRSVQEMLRLESSDLIWSDPELMKIVQGKELQGEDMEEEKWFRFVDRVSNRAFLAFGDHLLDHLSGANVFNLFQSLGSAGALYTLLAPYFVSFSLFNTYRHFSEAARRHFLGEAGGDGGSQPIKVAHFTDTLFEVNGVAGTLRQQVKVALETGKDLTLITCYAGLPAEMPGIRNFMPVGTHELPEYPEQKLNYPPFLEILKFCFENRFTHIHSATPGPVGLAALATARILGLPFHGTYHTALPQYAQHLTSDEAVEELVWRYTLWYYDQMDLIFTPSRSTASELIQKGIASEKVRTFPRGVDVVRFHPSKRNGVLAKEYNVPESVKILYVGRVSREKNLSVLEEVFKKLVGSTGQSIHLVVVGDGPYAEEMRSNMEGLPCTFTGYLEGERLASVYASSDIFVFPSTTDTFGNVVLEAQASGLPVIVSDAGGPKENMIDGKTGLIARANDSDSLLNAVKALLESSQTRREMAAAARRYMEERSFENAFGETWNIYHQEPSIQESQLARAI